MDAHTGDGRGGGGRRVDGERQGESQTQAQAQAQVGRHRNRVHHDGQQYAHANTRKHKSAGLVKVAAGQSSRC